MLSTGSTGYCAGSGRLRCVAYQPRFRGFRGTAAGAGYCSQSLRCQLYDDQRPGHRIADGAGKSLIALLVCEAWRREGATVAVLTGNKALARQMEAEGQRLGVPAVRFEGEGSSIPLSARRRYGRAEAGLSDTFEAVDDDPEWPEPEYGND